MLNHYWQLIQKNNLFGLRDDTRIGVIRTGEAGVGGRRAAASVGECESACVGSAGVGYNVTVDDTAFRRSQRSCGVFACGTQPRLGSAARKTASCRFSPPDWKIISAFALFCRKCCLSGFIRRKIFKGMVLIM